MITKTHTPETNVKNAIQVVYAVTESVWKMLNENNPKDWAHGLTQLQYTYLERGIFVAAQKLHELLEDEEFDADEVRDAVTVFFATAEKTWKYIEKAWGKFSGMTTIGAALELSTEQLVCAVESWYKGPGPTKVATNFADLAKVTGEG